MKYYLLFIIIIFSIAFLFRVIYQKIRMRQAIQWRKQRKMTIQLLSISFLYLILLFSFTLVDFLIVCGVATENLVNFREYALYLHFFMMLLLPFICVLSLPELRTKFFNILHLHRQIRRIDPIPLTNKTCMNNQTHISN